jgi:ABC-type transport system involved in multi-copper enzyme maturation permease subunit
MNLALLRHAWRLQRTRLAFVSVALAVWGFMMPVIYAEFGSQFSFLMESGVLPEAFARFAGGDVFSLPGSIALGFIHPIAISLTSVFAVGFSASAVAGERQRGTLEVALARPISRRELYLTLLGAAFVFVAVAITALVAGSVSGAAFSGVAGQLPLDAVPLLWLNAVLLFGAVAAIGLAASVSFDRLPPALGWTLGIVITMYILEVLGTLWPDAHVLQPYSLFHYFKANAILTGSGAVLDLAVLLSVTVLAMVWALVVFPRRDLAAPS